ncbi:choline sulfate utilization transcriptional regulator [Marinobacterium rhizophilum]|uniref:LysR family transcriptional regulator n=1 Tax=Marinobacterium rhizophilum TaxID=420402 RepID=A0ABY5HNI1_9GAMM|nr:LysR substrate-binding domain-containing protein [Marinobacterium rhizophilum]UTW13128.1 LysR family transcriptional regulator [Marinobacterium rhizophilum]
MTRFSQLPSLVTLQAFEAAARLGNFTLAATELGSTQSAVSQQIRRLEEDLGAALFLRAHRGVTLTLAGETFLTAVLEGLQRLSDGVGAVQQSNQHLVINVATDYAFAAFWILPRLAGFREHYPHTEVRVVTSQQRNTPAQPEFDLAILFGSGYFPGCISRPLFQEEAVMVCSPSLLKHADPITRADQLAQLPLLKLDTEYQLDCFTWPRIFRALGIKDAPPEPHMTFNNYTLLLQAAIAGQGIAIGWAQLVDSLLDNGLLVPLLDKRFNSTNGYHVVLPQQRPIEPVVQGFADWLYRESLALPT